MNKDFLLFALLGIIWGVNFLFMKMAVSVISPMQVAFLRVLFGAIPILIFGFLRKELKLQHAKWTIHFIVMGILAILIPYVGFIKGTQLLKSGAAGAISGVIPLVTICFATLFLAEEKLNGKKVIGVLLGFLGVSFVAGISDLLTKTSTDALYGAGFMLFGSCGYAAAVVYTKKYVSGLGLSSVALASYQTFIATIMMAFLTSFDGIDGILEVPQALLALALGLGLFGTGIAFIIYYHLIGKLGAVTASSVFYIPPLVALAVGSAIAGENISLVQGLGGILILSGVWISRSVNGKRT